MIVQITSRQFREEQKKYFDLADQGATIVLRRGKKQSYILIPVEAKDFEISPKMSQKIKDSIRQAGVGTKTSRSKPQKQNKQQG